MKTRLSRKRQILALISLIVFVAPARGRQRDAKVPDPDPELERKSFVVADGFEVNLFAADPLLAKPIQMNFDPAGRLWVACSEVYPQIKPGQKANDKILILEDTNGDGRADKTTVFADGLLDPDRHRAGRRRRLRRQQHRAAAPRPIRRRRQGRPDAASCSPASAPRTRTTSSTRCAGAPTACSISTSRSTSIAISRRRTASAGWAGAASGSSGPRRCSWRSSSAAGQPLGPSLRPLGPVVRHRRGQRRGDQLLRARGLLPRRGRGAAASCTASTPAAPSIAACEVVSGRHLPESWQGNLLTNDFRGHRVCRFVVSDDGAGYASREQPELIKTSHPAFRPIDIKMGPDGAIYIADWYNPIIQHGEVDFRDPRRDHTHGRIWRVTAKGRPLVPRPHAGRRRRRSPARCAEAPEDWTGSRPSASSRSAASEVLPELAAWVRQARTPNDAGHEHHCWKHSGPISRSIRRRAEAAHDVARAPPITAHARRRRVVVGLACPADRARRLLKPLVHDDHPQVRLEAVRALAQIHEARAVEVALRRWTGRWIAFSTMPCG